MRYTHKINILNNKKTSQRDVFLLAGLDGFEPSNAGVKVLCLTAWL